MNNLLLIMKIFGIFNLALAFIIISLLTFFPGTERIGIIGIYCLLIGLRLIDSSVEVQ